MVKGLPEEIKKNRSPEQEVHPILLSRWSARAMSGEPLSDKELTPLFEAAKWAPSSFNGQPWRFIYAKRDTKHWDAFFDLLLDFNQQWCKNAAVLMVVISRKTFELNDKPARTHSFDAGAAWENLAIEGTHRGLVVHAMSGFDYDKAREVLGIPELYSIECMVAVGKRGRTEDLPKELQEKEIPSTRKPLKEILMIGKFSED